MFEELRGALNSVIKNLFNVDIEPELTRPDEQFGDYATNVAMQLAGKVNKPPRDIAEQLAEEIRKQSGVAEVTVAGPGFLNIFLTNDALAKATWSATDLPQPHKGQEVLVEFGDPNPFKEMHIGHLYSYIVGDAIASLFEASGASVRRLSYHGDVGLHVAKAIWGMQGEGILPVGQRHKIKQNIGLYYQKGNQAYETDAKAKAEIQQINEHIYKRDDEAINKLHAWGKDASLAYFDNILSNLDIKTDKRYLESQAAEAGADLVRHNVGRIFKESQGAIVFEGEKVGLHTRVFITKQDLPTYEAKDLGLAELKKNDYPKASKSLIVTAHEQSEYFKVVLAALKEIDEQAASITKHIPHGFVSLSMGKMSSRTGEVYGAVDLLSDVETKAKELYPKSTKEIWLAAVKFGFLQHRIGSDIIYDTKQSLSLQGSSGPYLQYAHARARSILAKAKQGQIAGGERHNFNPTERSLARKISEYPEVVQRTVDELLPNYIATYLYELAQSFNSFYEKNRVLDDPRQQLRLKLVEAYAEVLKNGLNLLNISAPDKM